MSFGGIGFAEEWKQRANSTNHFRFLYPFTKAGYLHWARTPITVYSFMDERTWGVVHSGKAWVLTHES